MLHTISVCEPSSTWTDFSFMIVTFGATAEKERNERSCARKWLIRWICEREIMLMAFFLVLYSYSWCWETLACSQLAERRFSQCRDKLPSAFDRHSRSSSIRPRMHHSWPRCHCWPLWLLRYRHLASMWCLFFVCVRSRSVVERETSLDFFVGIVISAFFSVCKISFMLVSADVLVIKMGTVSLWCPLTISFELTFNSSWQIFRQKRDFLCNATK